MREDLDPICRKNQNTLCFQLSVSKKCAACGIMWKKSKMNCRVSTAILLHELATVLRSTYVT
jgi:hypothetical protein